MDGAGADYLSSKGSSFSITATMVDNVPMLEVYNDPMGSRLSEYNNTNFPTRLQFRNGAGLPLFGQAFAAATEAESGVSLTLPELKDIGPAQHRSMPKMKVSHQIKSEVIRNGLLAPQNIDAEEHKRKMTPEQRETFKRVLFKLNKMLALEEFCDVKLHLHQPTGVHPYNLEAKIVTTIIKTEEL